MPPRLLILTALILTGCDSGTMPPGYEAACYGGDFRKYLDGTVPQRQIIVKAGEADWPRLAADLTAAGAKLGLKVLDTSAHSEALRTIEVHLCSSEGLWISADQRIWSGIHAKGGNAGKDFSRLEIEVNGYKPQFDWRRTSDELADLLRPAWQIEVVQRSST